MPLFEPANYEAWYHTERGRWIAAREFELLWRLLQPQPAATLLDVGCGTGHFSRAFARAGLAVTGVEPDPAMLDFARQTDGMVRYRQGRAEGLPFADASFDHVVAITSLCFVAEPAQALGEMWRVARRVVALGLLHRPSLLWWRKRHSPGYAGARWDRWREVRDWIGRLDPAPAAVQRGFAVFGMGEGRIARWLEAHLPLTRVPLGGFMAVAIHKPPA